MLPGLLPGLLGLVELDTPTSEDTDMAFNSNNPEFPFYGVSLVTSPRFDATSVGAQVVLRLDPYNVVDGQVVRPMVTIEVEGVQTQVVDQSRSVSVVYGDAYVQAASDPALAQALYLVSQGLQAYINAKGL